MKALLDALLSDPHGTIVLCNALVHTKCHQCFTPDELRRVFGKWAALRESGNFSSTEALMRALEKACKRVDRRAIARRATTDRTRRGKVVTVKPAHNFLQAGDQSELNVRDHIDQYRARPTEFASDLNLMTNLRRGTEMPVPNRAFGDPTERDHAIVWYAYWGDLWERLEPQTKLTAAAAEARDSLGLHYGTSIDRGMNQVPLAAIVFDADYADEHRVSGRPSFLAGIGNPWFKALRESEHHDEPCGETLHLDRIGEQDGFPRGLDERVCGELPPADEEGKPPKRPMTIRVHFLGPAPKRAGTVREYSDWYEGHLVRHFFPEGLREALRFLDDGESK